MLQRIIHPLSAAIAVAIALLVAEAASAQATRPARAPELNPRWFDRLDPTDRALLQQLVGYAPPAFTADLTWIGRDPATWAALRGKVVLLQSWTNKSTVGRNAVKRAEKLAAAPENADLRVIFLHTPDGAENLQNFLERRAITRPVALDSRGGFCDDIGFFKQPTNILVDRNGVVRLAGLNSRGLKAGIESLLAEPADPSITPPVRGETQEPEAAVEFPKFTVPVNDAEDLRGKSAPPFYVKGWETPEPNARGKVVVLNFWSTECDICVRLLGHLNDLATRFADEACVVGISDESSGNYEEGLAEHRMRDSDLRHAIALDPTRRMKNAMGIRRIPHCVVISSDWIVRWQGQPARLEADVLSRIIRADRARGPTSDGVAPRRPRRWTREGA